LENAKELVEEFKREHREEVKELRRQEQEEEERSSVRNYLGNSQQNYYMVGKEEDMKERGKRDGMKIGIDGKIPWDKET